MLDALGMRVYSFVIPTLLAGWHISPTGAGMLGTVTLLASAVGGWLSGIAADRYGRAAVLQATILLIRAVHVRKRLHAKLRAAVHLPRLR